MNNLPCVNIGVVTVSRNCFPKELSRKRLDALLKSAKEVGLNLISSLIIVESETDAIAAAKELSEKGTNALVIYLGNFGPEGPATILMQHFSGPIMVCAAAEESAEDLYEGRGDAFCGLLNCCYNIHLRNLNVYIPSKPVGLPDDLISEIKHFENIARVYIGVKGLKVFAFGPRPQDFFACNAPIKPLYDLGIEVMENSELDIFQLFKEAEGNSDIKDIVRDMEDELGKGNTYPDLLPKLAQFESCLKHFTENNLGSKQFAVFANKCWPAFERTFGFVPCFVNARMAKNSIPIACEVDIYGAVSEYIIQLAGMSTATLLDINNTVPKDLFENENEKEGFSDGDLFMGFHCGNTASSMLCQGCSLKYQLIMNRLMEDGNTPDITRGTLEGQLKPGDATIFRLQSTADCRLCSYIAEGKILKVDPRSFGAIGVIGIKELSRFYRYVLLEKAFPHHTALTRKLTGKVLFDAVKLLTGKIAYTPLAKEIPYPSENPF